MTEERKAALRASWTPERRQEYRDRARAQFERWAAEHPDRATLVRATWAPIREGGAGRPTCQDCGAEAKPWYDWAALVVVGWYCPAHRPAQPMEAPATAPAVAGEAES